MIVLGVLVIGGYRGLRVIGDVVKSIRTTLPMGNGVAAIGIETYTTSVVRTYESLRVKFDGIVGIKYVDYATYDGKEVSAEACVFPGAATKETARSFYQIATGHFESSYPNMWLNLHDGSRSVNYTFNTRNNRWIETILTAVPC